MLKNFLDFLKKSLRGCPILEIIICILLLFFAVYFFVGCATFKADAIKVGQEIEEVGHDVEIAAEVVTATGSAIGTVGKGIEDAAGKLN